jgi:hypothetical protein
MNAFMSKDNITMIWDVISDEDIFKFLSKDIQNDIYKVFLENLQMFYDTERKKSSSLVEVNKKYIMLLLNHIKTQYQQKIPSKIKIINELSPPPPTKSLITYEEIHNERKTQFEEDLTKLEEEFTSAMTLHVPDVPDFTDKYSDEPISEIDKLLKEMTSKRNYDIEKISQNHSNATNWLKPQETSIKSDKFLSSKEKEKEKEKENENRKILEQKKNVTWNISNEYENDFINENIRFEESENNIEQSIFKKLKKVDPPNSENKLKNLEEQVMNLENQVMILNNKMDLILNLLQEK